MKLVRIVALSAVLFATAADARDIRIAPAAPPAHPANGVMYTNFAKYLPEESDGRLTATILGPEVVNLTQMKDALQSQITEVGNLLPLYFPADLPNMALTGELALTGTSPHAMASAMTEFMVTCAACQAEMRSFGTVFLGAGSSDVYALLTTRPVTTPEDLQGLRLRSGGAPWSRWAEHFGAVPANMSVFDQFEAISQGVIEGTMASAADLISFRLVEVVKDITALPLGTYHATSNFAVSNATWDSLSPEDRAAMARAANRANADFTNRWGFEQGAEAREAAQAAGITFLDPSPELVEASAEFAKADQATAAEIARTQFGIEDAEARVARFLELVDKWAVIADELNNDPAAIAERVQTEVWDKVDYTTYGL